jgi:hypothetical protein
MEASEINWQAILGYLNFSEGRPDPRFQQQLNQAWGRLSGSGEPVVPALARTLNGKLRELHAAGAAAFRDISQAEGVLRRVFDQVLPAYRQFHADLLAHLSDAELFGPFFLARVFEAVLAQPSRGDAGQTLVQAVLDRLNDFVGYRPVPVLETRPRGEPYEHERLRPIPLYIRGAGVACGRYHDLVATALDILRQTDPDIFAESQFNLDNLDELAADPRAYDHGHPANRRPNYVFGEWDPHLIDNQGRYRRLVVRQHILDLLLRRVDQTPEVDPAELRWEAAAALAGLVLMAAGTTGSGPGSYDSSVTLSVLVQKIAAYRDAFYEWWLERVPHRHGERLRKEAAAARQPFSLVRRHLNMSVAQHRATQLQQRHLALLLAEMGYPDASREQAARIPTPSIRIQSEILIRITQGNLAVDQGELDQAASLLPEMEELIRRGIECGALVDPWNILGYQGLFPLSPAREDSIHDHRVDELIYLLERLFDLYARLIAEAAAASDPSLRDRLSQGIRRLATWWDSFASTTVEDVRRLDGKEAAQAAEHVAAALARWRQQGEAAADLPFWQQYLHEFRSPKAFAQVVAALLDKHDHQAAMALLMSWLSQAEQVPLEDGTHSFHILARRWLLSCAPLRTGDSPAETDFTLIRNFLNALQGKSGELWDVPELDMPATAAADEDEDENLYSAAYAGMVYRDSADDHNEGPLLDDQRTGKGFALEEELPYLEKRLRFLSTVGQLWQVAARIGLRQRAGPSWQSSCRGWLDRARQNRRRLLQLLDTVQQYAIPEPASCEIDPMLEWGQQRAVKERLLELIIGTCLEMTLAVRALQVAGDDAADSDEPGWIRGSVRCEQALWGQDAKAAVEILNTQFLPLVIGEPVLYTPLSSGGQPRTVLQARVVQAVLRILLQNLPRVGLLRDTWRLLHTIRTMEENQPVRGPGRRVTEFDRLFRYGLVSVTESIVESAAGWSGPAGGDRALVEMLKAVTRPFYRLWVHHSNSLHLSSLERITDDEQMAGLRQFIQRYGRDIFHSQFMRLDHLRGVLQRGIPSYLDSLAAHPDSLRPIRLIEELGTTIPREHAIRWLDLIINALIENYAEFKDYNTTTAQSDYGDNLYVLLSFCRVKASYDRYAWQHRPLVVVHEVLAREGRPRTAELWEAAYHQLTAATADQHVQQLAALEAEHGLQLRTIRDRIEERFTKPLAIDRLCVLAAPAIDEARNGPGPGLARFLEELQVHAATPTGSGLDVPHWLERLQQEVRRLRSDRTAGGSLRDAFLVPRLPVSRDDVQRQLADWPEGPGEQLPPPS